MSLERLQKILAKAGLGSRRQCEELINQGRVIVNGEIAVIGEKADIQKDTILFDGTRIKNFEPLKYYAIYKPRNVISAVSSPDPRPTIRELVPESGRLFPVGRLDVDSEGLVLLTNDGDLANKITHPRYGCDKEYRVLVPRTPDEQQLKAWRLGIVLEDGYKTAPAKVTIDTEEPRGTWLRVVMSEGRKRQIREIGERLGLPVKRLIRTRIGTLQLGKLKPRDWRELSKNEIDQLKMMNKTKRSPKKVKSKYKRNKKM